MNPKLHHINLSTNNVAGMNHFYSDILGLKTETEDLPVLEKTKGNDGDEIDPWGLSIGSLIYPDWSDADFVRAVGLVRGRDI